MHATTFAIALIATMPTIGARATPGAQASEREQLQHSLTTACKIFTGTESERWAKADQCRRAWFKAHEEAIWRLKLNPHGRPVRAPSS